MFLMPVNRINAYLSFKKKIAQYSIFPWKGQPKNDWPGEKIKAVIINFCVRKLSISKILRDDQFNVHEFQSWQIN